ncbi:MAG TPA: FtsX-like permease family protein [Gaiellaceae bacterium]|nr:FtsX-like permease family protein [Gaiellaceae bacterium]
MLVVALKGLAGRKLRAALTAIAIILGVAMISGTYVLTDTINSAFTSIFTQTYQNADAIISGKTAFTNDNGNGVQAPSFPQSLLPKVQALPDVKEAAGSVTDDQTKLVGRDGKVISTHGAPGLAFSVNPTGDQSFNPLKLTAGRWPNGPDEIAIDSSIASSKNYALGDMIGIERNGPVKQFRVVGIATLPGVSIGSATISVFDLPTLQKLLGRVGMLDLIRVQAKSGVPTSRLIAQIKPLLPPSAQVRNVAAQVKEDKKSVNGFTSFIRYFLLAFAAIALFVGSFVIANTLSITIAQRTREFATLRTLGATRKQIRRAVVIEALVIGILGSITGLFLGLALAKGLEAVFKSIGIDLPTAGTVFATRTVVVCLLVGTIVTLLASLRPARRAMRVPPIAAVREGAELPRGRFARWTPYVSAATLLLGILLLVYGVLAHNLATGTRLFSLGVGILLLFFGVSANAERVVRPLASVLGWPAARLGGAAGALARDNTKRNPKRTASTASALMIGLALVTFVAILGQGIRSSFESAVDDLFKANYALTADDTFTPLTIAAEKAVAKAPGVTTVSGIRAGSAKVFGKVENLTGADAQLTKVVHLDWKEGSNAVPAELGQTGAFVDDKYAKKHHLHIGSPLTLETPTAKHLHVKVDGVFKLPKGGSPFGTVTISNALFDANYVDPQNEMAFVNIKGGVTDANTAALNKAVADFADAKIQTHEQFKASFEKPLNSILSLLYVLLALSVVVSLFGIVNTLVLTVFERTREIGMLRAVGLTRRQTRRMIRNESIVTSLIGAALGIVVGFFLGLLVTHALSDEGIVFAVPWVSLVFFVIAAIIIGILAAIWPARRAANLNVLQALQYE